MATVGCGGIVVMSRRRGIERFDGRRPGESPVNELSGLRAGAGRRRDRMKITDLKCAVIGGNPIVRIKTDSGIDGLGQAEWTKPYLKPHVLFYRDMILGQDPTDVERVVDRIRRMGSFKPWGAAVSAIEVALWDIAGKAAGLPVYKLLGGKVRDKVRVYNGGVRVPLKGNSPEHYAEDMARMKELREGFTIIKQGISFHSAMPEEVPDYFYGERPQGVRPAFGGPLTERGLKHTVACIEAMKEALGDEIGLALDCGPWSHAVGRAAARKGGGAAERDVAGGHDHRETIRPTFCRTCTARLPAPLPLRYIRASRYT